MTVQHKHPERDRARSAVTTAVASGRLTRPTACEGCAASPCKPEAHHADYSKPLEVEWLCRPCHLKRHTPPPREKIRTLVFSIAMTSARRQLWQRAADNAIPDLQRNVAPWMVEMVDMLAELQLAGKNPRAILSRELGR